MMSGQPGKEKSTQDQDPYPHPHQAGDPNVKKINPELNTNAK